MDQDKLKIRSFLSRFFRADAITDNDDFFAQGYVNSLFAMQLVMWVEKEFDISIEDQDLDIQNFNTVNAVAGFVERKLFATVAV